MYHMPDLVQYCLERSCSIIVATNSALPFSTKEHYKYTLSTMPGLFPQVKLTTNVHDCFMNIHDLPGRFPNYFILVRLIWFTVAAFLVYIPAPASRCQQSCTRDLPNFLPWKAALVILIAIPNGVVPGNKLTAVQFQKQLHLEMQLA